MIDFEEGDIYDIRIERVAEDGTVSTVHMVAEAQPDMIRHGANGRWYPGLEVTDSGDASAFEEEWALYCINEGGDLSGKTYEPDDQGMNRRYVATKRSSCAS